MQCRFLIINPSVVETAV